MSSIAVVTSCSAEGYAQYGARFVESFDEHWPPSIGLYIVSENTLSAPACTKTGRLVEVLSLSGAVPAVADFYTRHANNPNVRGGGQLKDFRRNAWKFSKKIFAINMVAHRIPGLAKLIWIDADVVTFAPVPQALLASLPPHYAAVAYLDRGKYHSECGFVSYNMRNPLTLKFIDEMQSLYTNDGIFQLKEWHDCFAFDSTRVRMRLPAYKIPHTSNSHPFVHSVLGKYMDHLKGLRKARGFSPDHPRFKVTKPGHPLFRGGRTVTN